MCVSVTRRVHCGDQKQYGKKSGGAGRGYEREYFHLERIKRKEECSLHGQTMGCYHLLRS